MSTMASQITSLVVVYGTVYTSAQRKHQSSAPLVFVRGIHRRPVNSPHKGPVTRKMFPFDDVIMNFINELHAYMRQTLWSATGNALSLVRRQVIIWTNANSFAVWSLGTNFSKTTIKIHKFSFKKMHFNMSSAKCQPFRLQCVDRVLLNSDYKGVHLFLILWCNILTRSMCCFLFGLVAWAPFY